MISESVDKCIEAIRYREKCLRSALDREKRLSQEILNRQRERIVSKKNSIEKVD